MLRCFLLGRFSSFCCVCCGLVCVLLCLLLLQPLHGNVLKLVNNLQQSKQQHKNSQHRQLKTHAVEPGGVGADRRAGAFPLYIARCITHPGCTQPIAET
jgi:hypothetical protein